MAREQTAKIGMKRGLHARPALLLTRLCETFASDIRLRRGRAAADGKRILDVLTLGAGFAAEIVVRAEGADEEAAAAAIAAFLETEEEDE